MTGELTKSALDRLSDRLRKTERPSGADTVHYLGYREEFTTAFDEVMDRLASLFPESPPSGRRKTLDTVVAKLKRQKTRLSTMQDIVGCRIIVPGLIEQDDAVALISEHFDVRRTDDLRNRPHSGYRAVHVIITASNGRFVEIQVRTQLQDIYAQLVEQMADTFGIDLKYGGGDPFALEILAASAQRAYELDVSNKVLDARQRTHGPAQQDDEFVELSHRIEVGEMHYLTTVSAIIDSLGSHRERTQ